MIYENSFGSLSNYALFATTLVESVCGSIIIYLALFHSEQMKRYRFLIINNVICSCMFNWFICFSQPSFLPPSICVVFYSKWIRGSYWSLFCMCIIVACFVNVSLSVTWSLLYRYCMAYPGVISTGVEKGPLFIILTVSFQIGLYCLLFCPFTFHHIPNQVTENHELLRQLPQLYSDNPDFGFFCAPTVELARKYAFAGFILVACFFVFGVVLYSIMFHRTIIKPVTYNISNTQRLHLILFKAVTVQIIVAYLFVLFPTAGLYLAVSEAWEEGTSISAALMMLYQLHGCVDFITMIYFITPYRRKLLEMIRHKDTIVRIAEKSAQRPTHSI